MSTRRIHARFLIFLLLLVVPAAVSSAQVSTGTIGGTVTDSKGAVVPHAAVIITNNDTGIQTRSVTGSTGDYSAPNLQTGAYTVSVSVPGFSEGTINNVQLNVGAEPEINFSLKVGVVGTTIEVTSAQATVDLISSTTMPVVDQRTIVELPLNGRDWTSLANLQPGVAAVRTQPAVAVSNQRANRGVGSQLTVSGARPQQNNYRVDGVSINDYSNGGPGGVIGSNLGVDAIQEFSVVTSNATADYGKTAGGVINAVTRAGGNKFHGSAYEFLRNSALDARDEFDAVNSIAHFRRNQFGASIGGPIHRDQTFFFFDYEGLRQYKGISISSNVPNADARGGLLVCTQPALPASQNPNCFTPGTTTVAASGTTGKQQTAVNSSVTRYLTFYPLPNSGTINSPTSDIGLFLFNAPSVSHENFYTGRLDHNVSAKDSLSSTYFYDTGALQSPDPFNIRITGNIAQRELVTVGESHVFSPSIINSLKVGYSRVVSIAPTTLAAINASAGDTSLGFAPNLPVGLINVGGISNFQGGLKATGEFDFHLNSYQLYDDVYYSHGNHTIKIGFAVERLQNNQLGTANPNGQFVFSNLASFLSATPTSFNGPLTQGTAPRDLRQSVFGAYITDNYRITPTLTLNLGIRYEPVTVPTETANRLALLKTLTANPTTDPTANHTGSPYFQNSSLKNFAPRIGFAWDPFNKDKTSVRGGYGIYDTQTLNYLYEGLSIFTAPYLQLGNVSAGACPPAPAPCNTLVAGDFPKNAYAKMNAAGPVGLRYAYTDQQPKRGFIQQYSLNVQQQFPYDFTMQVGYAGSRGIHLPYRVDDVNTVQPIIDAQGYGFFGPNCAAGSCKTTAQLTAAKLNPNVGQISAVFMSGYSHYNSLQASLNKRFAHSTQMGLSYTWAKSIDDGSSSTFGDTFANSVSSLPTWAPDRRRAISDFIVAHNIVLNYLYELPKVSETSPLSALLNGWQWGGIYQFSTGEPFTPLISGDSLSLKSGDAFAFPDRLRGPGCSGNPVKSFSATNRSYVNAACFAFPTFDPVTGYTHLGNAGRNSIIGPSLSEFDTSLVKNTRFSAFSEQLNIQFRAELFNVLNHGNYGPPPKAGTQFFSANGSPLSAASAGVLVGPAATSSRQAQFALKILF